MRLEYKSESSNKFWEASVEGNTLTVCFGKIGTTGQTNTKKLSSIEKAEVEYRKIVCEKLAKGYKPTAKTVLALLESVAFEKSEAVCSAKMQEHTDREVANDLCQWLTACIQHGMSPVQFRRTWKKFEEEDEKLLEVFDEWWLEYQMDDLSDFYAQAFEKGADRFVWHYQNAFVDLVACKGDPGVRAIKVCVLTEKYCKDQYGNWLIDWPQELGAGAPIAWIDHGGAILRDGRLVAVDN
jgi:predicted DNA-binding WGR domain protein